MYNYKNPFSEYDTNVMTSEQISEFFTEPYESFTIPESKIIEDKSPIIFIGGRGTGKTMLLRQFSYNVQKITQAKETYFDKLKETNYIGIYFRIDKPLLQSLSSLGRMYDINCSEESIFTHFLELTIFKEYLEIVKILEKDANINEPLSAKILSEILSIFPMPKESICDNIDDLLQFVINEINYIWDFQSEKAIDIDNKVQFTPKCNCILQGRLSDEFCKTKVFELLGLTDISVLLLIDEFESFSEKQQMVINAAMRYNKEYGTRLRIGMRPHGFKTYDTVNSEDFIKEGRDYSKIEFDNPLVKKQNNKSYFELIKRVAEKRLASVPMFAGMNIFKILGPEEDLESEAKDIVKGRIKHIEIYLKEINKNKSDKERLNIESLKNIRDDNPLYEMECLRLLLKGKSLKYVEKALNDYKNEEKSDEAKKFSDDYIGKYKLSFVFVLCSIYKREKKAYYGFLDYCYLSSGIIGSFIELCRRAFDLAFFKDSVSLSNGIISKEVQTDAAYEYSYAERDMICRIAEHGKQLDIFINNIGNAFSYIHRDIYLRYPETNMFPVNADLSDENKKLLDIACKWSLIIKKPNIQASSTENTTHDMFMLSRVFSPVFKISYRTRGGLNPIKRLTDDFFSIEFKPESVLKEKSNNTTSKNTIRGYQLTLFDI